MTSLRRNSSRAIALTNHNFREYNQTAPPEPFERREDTLVKIVVLDGYTENPGDLDWGCLETFGDAGGGL